MPGAVAGPVHAPAIVCLHGGALTHAMWQPQMAALAGTFRVVALDLPGHGVRAGKPFRLPDAVRATHDAIARQTRGQALVVGLSLGGYVAMAFAGNYPERVTGLVLSGCSVDYRGYLGALARVNALLLRIYPLRMLSRLNVRTLRALLPPDLAEPQIAAGFFWRGMGQGFAAMAGKDFPAMLHAYPGPVLIVNGEHDALNRRGERAVCAAVRQARVACVVAAGRSR